MAGFDELKAQLSDAVDQHGAKIDQALDQAAKVIDEKTGGRHSDKIAEGMSKAREVLDGLDGKDDDLGRR